MPFKQGVRGSSPRWSTKDRRIGRWPIRLSFLLRRSRTPDTKREAFLSERSERINVIAAQPRSRGSSPRWSTKGKRIGHRPILLLSCYVVLEPTDTKTRSVFERAKRADKLIAAQPRSRGSSPRWSTKDGQLKEQGLKIRIQFFGVDRWIVRIMWAKKTLARIAIIVIITSRIIKGRITLAKSTRHIVKLVIVQRNIFLFLVFHNHNLRSKFREQSSKLKDRKNCLAASLRSASVIVFTGPLSLCILALLFNIP